MILATDMAKHAADVSRLKELANQAEVSATRENVALALYTDDDEQSVFKNQQFLLECCLHSSDVSYGARPNFDVVHEWTYLLFQEFFTQGDIEKQMGLPVSMLCDRDTVNVAKSQPGFGNFVCIPLFKALSNFLPALTAEGMHIDNLKKNLQAWEKYEEGEEDRRIYCSQNRFEANQVSHRPSFHQYLDAPMDEK
jgi:cAMP-specific phosphodiesterase 4